MTENRLDTYLDERLAAAECGRADALYDLGLCYSTGNGVDLNYVEAHKWFNLAAVHGIKSAALDREELAQEMTPPEIAEAQKQARAWMAAH